MKKPSLLFAALVLGACICSAQAQPQPQPRRGGMAGGGMMGGPGAMHLGGAAQKLFGENTNFTASVEIQIKPAQGNTIVMPGKMSLDHGNSRTEMDLTKASGTGMPEAAAAQMKAMGMDQMVSIGRPDKKAMYIIYPGMKAYVEMTISDEDLAARTNDLKLEKTELGRETVDGHACVKNKVVITDEKGVKHESTVWNATDLKNFPVKFDQTENGTETTMQFKDVKLGTSAAGTFDAPTGFTKYTDVQTMMMQEMMKRRGGG